ncbi:transmembrane protein, putative [Actinidia rufa]|uniref:Transmembrane protein, putative n=1 Tax=Actinidia rufa TaxID=165716 RepID=A0A7J0FV83_9ERIC|nr:transmembrane protein, putative [Actinidia rufa]
MYESDYDSDSSIPYINRTRESTNTTHVNLMQKCLIEIRRQGLRSTTSRDSVCVNRVPPSLTRIDHRAIEPEIVSIGPYHRGKVEVSQFESYKWQFLDALLCRSANNGVDLQRIMQEMEGLERKARRCYLEPIPMSNEDFVEMMVLDGCFVIELLQQVCGNEDPVNLNSSIVMKPWLIPILIRDLLKLENQLPFFVLQRLFHISISTGDSLSLLALKFFNLALPRSLESLKRTTVSEAMTLLDLFHSSSLPSNISQGSQKEYHPFSDQTLPCVTQLRLAGIKFRPHRSTDNFLNISFCKGELKIPPTTINDVTSTIFVNCAALEQCRAQHIPTCFSAYIAFMSCLINSARDVSFLCDDGIITGFSHHDQRISQLFKELGENIVFNVRECYLSKEFGEVEAYYSSNWSALRRTYFSNPWSIISLVSASVLLALTAIQTIMAIVSYKGK